MAYDFPTSPVDGQTANGFTWNGYAWARAGGGGAIITDGDKGDVIVAGSGTTWTLDPAVTTSINNKVAKAGDTMSGALSITNTTASALPTTGALTVAGGVGIAGALNVAATATSRGSTNGWAFEERTNAAKFAMWYRESDLVYLYDNTIGTVLSFHVGTRAANFTGNISTNSTTASTSPTTGALTVAGGVGVAGNVWASGFAAASGNGFWWGTPITAGTPGLNYAAGTFIFSNYGSAAALTINPTTQVVAVSGKTYLNGADSAWVATYPPALGVKYVPASAAGITIRPTTDVGSAIIFTNAAGTSIGSVGTTATNVTYYTSSDGRLKDCLEEFDAGAMIDRLEAGTFRWKVNGERDYGVVAQDAVKVLPQAVTHDEKHDWWGIDYSKFVPLLLAEVKALRARLAEVEGRVHYG